MDAAPSHQVALPQQLAAGRVRQQLAAVDFSKYLPLYRAILAVNWEEALIFFNQHPSAIQSPLTNHLETALHVAARAGNNTSFMENLVAFLLEDNEQVEALSPRDASGHTPLHYAASHGNIEVAHILVRRNSNLLYLHNNDGFFPIHYAAMNYRKSKDAFLYFLRLTRDDEYGHPNPYAVPTGVQILVNLIGNKLYDLALQLVVRYPDLGRHKMLIRSSALDALVLYDCPIINKGVFKAESTTSTPIFYLITSLLPWLVKKSIVNKMVLHHQAMKLLKFLCDQLKTLNETQVDWLTRCAFLEATSLDIHQVIINIAEAYPLLVYFLNPMRQNILHVAVKNRSENVFNLVCGTSMLRINLSNVLDINRNSVLHLAGKLAPPHKLNLVSGAALQMQRELQWFKEVQKIAPSHHMSSPNIVGKTPSIVFTEEHKELKEAGEKWMKDTANSCTIAAALIVTVVFAAAISSWWQQW
ncbi:PREDICTED: uncharacterized protein LOC109168306 [Ipomoea nil]|uniref:uncharacterized protein LOC109168306 n=1 Tax=Ipomoea nil TaxID=35883 RepID=UPI00090136DD|nr:PREDICTED: uncharacterized protein LOC109168306 [Ipomoea nil]